MSKNDFWKNIKIESPIRRSNSHYIPSDKKKKKKISWEDEDFNFKKKNIFHKLERLYNHINHITPPITYDGEL